MSSLPSTNPDPGAWETEFAWYGVTPSGRTSRGKLLAADLASARATLGQRRIVALHIERRRIVRPKALRAVDVTSICKQLAGMLQAGLPLITALELIGNSHPRTAVALSMRALVRDIARGASFLAALERQPDSFDRLFRQLAGIGEASGTLVDILVRLADDRQRAAAQKARLRGALAYPAGVMLVAMAITAALLIWVVPTFKQVFEGFGAPLPPPTQAVIALSDAFVRGAPLACAALFCMGVTLRLAIRRFAACAAWLDQALLRLPCAGTLIAQIAVARWSRALGTLLRAGTPLADALDSVEHASGNIVFERATRDIAQRLRQGETLSLAMRACGCFPAAVVQPIEVAEQSGTLDAMLADLAALDEARVDERLALISSLAEPVIVALLGALVGALVLAMYLPIIELGNVV